MKKKKRKKKKGKKKRKKKKKIKKKVENTSLRNIYSLNPKKYTHIEIIAQN